MKEKHLVFVGRNRKRLMAWFGLIVFHMRTDQKTGFIHQVSKK